MVDSTENTVAQVVNDIFHQLFEQKYSKNQKKANNTGFLDIDHRRQNSPKLFKLNEIHICCVWQSINYH